MKNKRNQIIFVLLALLLPMLVFGETHVEIHRSYASEPLGDGWHLAVSTKGYFSLQVPEEFNDFTTLLPEIKGTIYTVGGKTDYGVVFIGMKTTLENLVESRAMYDQIFKMVQEGTIETSVEPLFFMAETEKTDFFIRVLVKLEGRSVYTLSYQYPKGLYDSSVRDSKRMFESFRVIN